MTTLKTSIKPQLNTSHPHITILLLITPMIFPKNHKNKLSNTSDPLNSSSEPPIINLIAPSMEKKPHKTTKAPPP